MTGNVTNTGYVGPFYEKTKSSLPGPSTSHLFIGGTRIAEVTHQSGTVLETHHDRSYGKEYYPLGGGPNGAATYKFNDRRDEGNGHLRFHVRNLDTDDMQWSGIDTVALVHPGILLAEGVNPFAYAGHDPINRMDSTGGTVDHGVHRPLVVINRSGILFSASAAAFDNLGTCKEGDYEGPCWTCLVTPDDDPNKPKPHEPIPAGPEIGQGRDYTPSEMAAGHAIMIAEAERGNDCLRGLDAIGFSPIAALMVIIDANRGSLPWSQVQRHAYVRRLEVGGASWAVIGALTGMGYLSGGPTKLPAIRIGHQSKHLPGHPNFDPARSTLFVDPRALAGRAGSGQQVGQLSVGLPGSRERVVYPMVIGEFMTSEGGIPTNAAIIHYAKTAIHIVPARPQ